MVIKTLTRLNRVSTIYARVQNIIYKYICVCMDYK